MKYFIANWKAYKDLKEANQWMDIFLNKDFNNPKIQIIICPPFPLIYPLKIKIKSHKNIYLGAQDVSTYPKGSYTGEVTARTLSTLVDYVIIGHNERRVNFHENDYIIGQKVYLAKKYKLMPIVCVSNANQKIPSSVNMIAYEPIESIGSGNNADLKSVLSFKNNLKIKRSYNYIYGGSVNKNNIAQYLASPEINGFLIATASLNPLDFYRIITIE